MTHYIPTPCLLFQLVCMDPRLAFFFTPLLALTYEPSSKEQAMPLSKVHERFTSVEEKIKFLELQVGNLQEELVNLKEENRKLMEQLPALPSLIGSHI